MRARPGLDQPIVLQYLSFLLNTLRGDLGTLVFFNQPINPGAGRTG